MCADMPALHHVRNSQVSRLFKWQQLGQKIQSLENLENLKTCSECRSTFSLELSRQGSEWEVMLLIDISTCSVLSTAMTTSRIIAAASQSTSSHFRSFRGEDRENHRMELIRPWSIEVFRFWQRDLVGWCCTSFIAIRQSGSNPGALDKTLFFLSKMPMWRSSC